MLVLITAQAHILHLASLMPQQQNKTQQMAGLLNKNSG
jgi:hypothetical protein